jgi:glutaredoxin
MWCKKTKKLLDDLGVKYTFVYVDLLDEAMKNHYFEEMKVWNPRGSFPTLVVNDRQTIIGYDEARIREALK